MKKLFFGLATSLLLCFAASSVNAQVRDTMDRQNDGDMVQQTWPADSNKQDSVNNVLPGPDNPISDPVDINTPNGNEMAPGLGTDTPLTPNTPSTAPGTSTNPSPQSDMPNIPRPNTSPNSPTTPTTGLPM